MDPRNPWAARRRMPPPGTLASRKSERTVREESQSSYGPLETRPAASTTPTPITIAKPQRVLNEPEEAWPTVGAAASSLSRARTSSPTKDSPSGSQSASASDGGQSRARIQIQSANQPAAVASQTTTPELARNKPSSQTAAETLSTCGEKQLKASVKLVNENMEWTENALEYLTDNTDFIVIGAIGHQGTGKSTLLSMLGGNEHQDMYRQYIFRPASREAVESCRHQTTGIHFYTTKTRVFLLDCQPIMSSSVVDEMIRTDKRYNFEYRTVENFAEIESLQLAAFMMRVCHTVIVCGDWFLDMNLVRFLQTAEMLRPTVSHPNETIQYMDTAPNLAFVQQRGKFDDFKPTTLVNRAKVLAELFKSSTMQLSGGLSLAKSRQPEYREGLGELSRINYFVMSDMKLRGQKVPATQANGFRGVADYESLMEDFRINVRSLPRAPFATGPPLTEKAWFQFASRSWDAVKKSHLIAEFGRVLN